MAWDAVKSASKIKGLVIRNGLYAWQEMIAGKRYHESLKIAAGSKLDEDAAVRLMHVKQRAALDGHTENLVTRAKRGTAKLGDIAEHLEQYAVVAKLSPRTVKGYIRSLYTVARVGGGVEDPEAASSSILTPELMEQYEHRALAAVEGGEDEMRAARNTVVSIRRHVRACFSRRVRNRMRDLILPDTLDDFLRAGDVREVIVWSLPDPELVTKTKAAALKLRDEGSDLWLVWLLCYGLGLRSSEAAYARWSWCRQTEQGWVIDVIARPAEWDGPKGTQGFVPIPAGMWAELEKAKAKGGVYILPGASYYARYWELIQRDFTQWMRKLGWETNHCAHELRRLRGSEWWTDSAVGPVVCSAWLRHSSLAVTQRHYAKLTQHPTAPECF
jgi:integrase